MVKKQKMIEMKNKQIISILLTATVLFSIIMLFPTLEVWGETGNSVTIHSPNGTTEVLFYNKLTVNFTVEKGDPPWIYTGADIYLNNIAVDSTTDGLSSPFVKTYYPEGYAGTYYVRVTAHFVKGWQDTEDVTTSKGNVVKNSEDTSDVDDLRIDKLHDYESNKGYLDGSGVTICIIDDYLRCDNKTNTAFHKSMYKSGKNDLYEDPERKFIDIKYYEYNFTDQDFYEYWEPETDTKEEKWIELFDEGQGNYSTDTDLHGTYCFATLRQIAPAANYIFISTRDDAVKLNSSIYWLYENYLTLGIDIISMSVDGTLLWEPILEEIVANGTIPVIAAGNGGLQFNNSEQIIYPCSLNSAIGVTGVPDSDYSNETLRWKQEDILNHGYGIDIASISEATKLDWEPVQGIDEFRGTSNACPLVAGTIALLEQYQNNYKSSTDLNVTIVQNLFQKTGDASGSAPSQQGTTISGSYDWLATNYTGYPYLDHVTVYSDYKLGWGIMDGYELFQYFRNNY